MKKVVIALTFVFLLSGCGTFLSKSPYKQLSLAAEKLEDWTIDENSELLAFDSTSYHDEAAKEMFFSKVEDSIIINVTIHYGVYVKKNISIEEVKIIYYNSNDSKSTTFTASPNLMTVDWDNIVDSLYTPEITVEDFFDIMFDISIVDVEMFFKMNDIAYSVE